MTSLTPASALMHAGFVTVQNFLLALFSTVLFASVIILFIIGGLTAVIAQFTKLLQVNEAKLACSTIAQMGFMIMQCGLGFSMRPSFTYYFMGFIKPTYFYLQERK
jgi:NAD(P)H-quinone oxidoreductase subunit 5